MNPPFGDPAVSSESYLLRQYASSNGNILCAFIQRACEMLVGGGLVGVIFDRTAIVKTSYEEFRRTVLLTANRLNAVVDLGWEVLDASVETTTSVLSHSGNESALFVDLRSIRVDEKGYKLLHQLDALAEGRQYEDSVFVDPTSFLSFPNAVIGYDFPDYLVRAFNEGLSLAASGHVAYTGHQFRTEKHFRLWWEVSASRPPLISARLFNGSGFSPLFTSLRDMLISDVDLEELPSNSTTNLRNKDKHLLPGVCFGKRGDFFCAHLLPPSHYFSLEGLAIPVTSKEKALEMLGVLNTPLARASLNKFTGQHKTSGYVNLFPYRDFDDLEGTRSHVSNALDRQIYTRLFDETQSLFSMLLPNGSVTEYAAMMHTSSQDALEQIAMCENFCHLQSIDAYGVSPVDQLVLEQFQARQPAFEFPIEDADLETV